jgi:hypothetical protein
MDECFCGAAARLDVTFEGDRITSFKNININYQYITNRRSYLRQKSTGNFSLEFHRRAMFVDGCSDVINSKNRRYNGV